ncbi:unnamed protein product [Linum tenue]|uniref:Bulb-type lectin domain-containing protein n=1 Tax=Linum tenue TaxID=586396 RepID=A0AAV0L8I9_9ROSI|nr:unnamed protein product [Linum tenue]
MYSNTSCQGIRLIVALQDTGNFVVRDTDDDDSLPPLWLSSDSPTDSWLQGMKLGVVKAAHGRSSGENQKLTSWLTDCNPASGAFTLEWDPTGGKEELVMKRRGMVFWTSGKLSGNRFPFITHRHISNPPDGGDEDYVIMASPSALRLTHQGNLLEDTGYKYVLYGSVSDANNIEDDCRKWEGPECRRRNDGGDRFVELRGRFGGRGRWMNGGRRNHTVGDCEDIVNFISLLCIVVVDVRRAH